MFTLYRMKNDTSVVIFLLCFFFLPSTTIKRVQFFITPFQACFLILQHSLSYSTVSSGVLDFSISFLSGATSGGKDCSAVHHAGKIAQWEHLQLQARCLLAIFRRRLQSRKSFRPSACPCMYTGEGKPGVEDIQSWVVLGLPAVVSDLLWSCALIVSRCSHHSSFLPLFVLVETKWKLFIEARLGR